MPNQHKVIEIDKTTECYPHVRLHTFNTPSMLEDNFYRQRISFDAFFYSCKQRNNNKKVLYYMVPESGIIDNIHDYKSLPVVEHEGLYEFFNYIGYDRKKKKIL